MTTTTTTTERTCAGPGCTETVTSAQPAAKFCSTRCRKAAFRARRRVERQRQRATRQTATTIRRRGAARSDPAQAAAEAEAYARALKDEAEASLARDPERRPWPRSTEASRAHRRRAAL